MACLRGRLTPGVALAEAAAEEGIPAQPGLRRAVTAAEEDAAKSLGAAAHPAVEVIEEIPVPAAGGIAAADDRCQLWAVLL